METCYTRDRRGLFRTQSRYPSGRLLIMLLLTLPGLGTESCTSWPQVSTGNVGTVIITYLERCCHSRKYL